MTAHPAGSRHSRLVRIVGGSLLLSAFACTDCPNQGDVASPAELVAAHLAGPPAWLQHGGPGALTVVILGDGFTKDVDSMTAYREAANGVASKLLEMAPFGALKEGVTVVRVDLFSDEAGIDVPASCGGESYNPEPPTPTSPPFSFARSEKHPANILETSWCARAGVDGQFGKFFLNSSSPNVAEAAKSAGFVPDITLVLVNDWMFGATAWPQPGVVYVSIGQNLVGDINPRTGQLLKPNDPAGFPDVTFHEIGHLAPFLLMDEYSRSQTTSTLTEAIKAVINAGPNLTTAYPPTEAVPLKWSTLVAPNTPLPTDCSVVQPDAGVVEGGYSFEHDVFHPACACRMNETYDAPFCVVCRRRILVALARHLPQAQPALTVGTTARMAWVVLDGLRIESAGEGYYGLVYQVQIGDQTVSGVWPPGRPARLIPGQTRVIGELLGRLPVAGAAGTRPVSPGPWLRVTYRLRKWLSPNGTGVGTTVADHTVEVNAPPPQGPVAYVVPRNADEYRLTLGVAVR